jgi:hypothetical protein
MKAIQPFLLKPSPFFAPTPNFVPIIVLSSKKNTVTDYYRLLRALLEIMKNTEVPFQKPSMIYQQPLRQLQEPILI